MLFKNVQTKAGLVNSTTGFLYNIEQALGTPTENLRQTLPYYLIIRIKKTDYTRSQLQDYSDYITIPIFTKKRAFYRSRNEYYRKQFPVRIAFVIIVYKAQGITLDRVVIDITSKEFTPRLRYIAVSRVKTIKSVIFKKPFDFSLFTNRLSALAIARKADIERRILQRLLPKNGSDYNT